MVLFLNKKKLQEQKPLANNTYQGKLVQQGYNPSFIIDEDGKIIKKENKLSLLQRITPTAEAAEIQTGRKPIEEIFTEDIERKKFDYQLNEEAERLNKPINIALRTITGIPKQTAIIGKEIGQSIARNVASFFSAETLSPILGKLQDIEKRLEENNITYGFFADEMRDRLLGDLSSDEVVELTGETRGEQVLPAEQRIEKLKNKLKEKANTYREKAKGENGIAKLVHETLADVLSTEGGALGISSTLVLGSIGLDLTGYGGTKKGLTKAVIKTDNVIDAAKVLMKAGLDEKTALGFADDVVKIKTTKAANSFIDNLETTLKTTKPVIAKQATSISDDLAKLKSQTDDLLAEAKKYKSAEKFVKEKTRNFGLPTRDVADEVYKEVYKGEKPVLFEVSKLSPTETQGTRELLGAEKFSEKQAGKSITNPIIVTEKGTILDGHNRYYQAIANGDKNIPAFILKEKEAYKSQLTDIWNKANKL